MRFKVRTPPLCRQWPLLVVGLLLLWATGAGGQDFWEMPAFPDRPPRGPAAAVGVVVYTHGNDDRREEWRAPPPPLMRLLADGGWDVLKFARRRAADRVEMAEAALVAEVVALRRRGYATIVLAGPSRGGWLALMAATRVPVHAVIATSPGGYGTRGDGVARSFAELRQRLPAIRARRVVVVEIAGDPRVERVGGRGPAIRAALAAAGAAALVIDRPPGFFGHTAAMSGRFARVHGPCILAFLAGTDGPCTAASGPAAGDDLPLPPDARAVRPRGLLGRWVGIHANGDVRMLVVTAVRGERVRAVWAWGDGPVARRERVPGFERLDCRRAGPLLACPRARGMATFRVRAGRLDYAWRPADPRKPGLSLVLRRPGQW